MDLEYIGGTQILGSELARSNIYPISEVLTA